MICYISPTIKDIITLFLKRLILALEISVPQFLKALILIAYIYTLQHKSWYTTDFSLSNLKCHYVFFLKLTVYQFRSLVVVSMPW